MASYITKYILKKETGQGNLLKGIEDESAKQEASTDMRLKNLPNYQKKTKKESNARNNILPIWLFNMFIIKNLFKLKPLQKLTNISLLKEQQYVSSTKLNAFFLSGVCYLLILEIFQEHTYWNFPKFTVKISKPENHLQENT